MPYGCTYGHFYGFDDCHYGEMTPTTLRTLRRALIPVVESIVPSYAEHTGYLWTHVPSMDDAYGGEVRTFFLKFMQPEAEFEDGLFGSGVTKRSELRIYTTYGGLADDDEEIIGDDHQDLWMTLERQRDPTQNGLVGVAALDFVKENEEPGAVYGYHPFIIHYLARDTVTP